MRKEFEIVHGAIADQQIALSRTQQSVGEVQQSVSQMQKALAQVEQAVTHLGQGLTQVESALTVQQQASIRQAHLLDQGFAGVNDHLSAHRENMGIVVFAYVNDLSQVKADVQDVRTRLDVLEKRTPPAA